MQSLLANHVPRQTPHLTEGVTQPREERGLGQGRTERSRSFNDLLKCPPSLASFPPSFMHSFNKHLLSACYVPGAVLGTETATPTAGAKPLVGKISINQIITRGNVRLQPEREGAHERLHRGARRGTLSSFVKWGLLACPPPSPPGQHAGS